MDSPAPPRRQATIAPEQAPVRARQTRARAAKRSFGSSLTLWAVQPTIDSRGKAINETLRRRSGDSKSPKCRANSAFPTSQDRQRDCAERREHHEGVGCVRILPLAAQLLPVRRQGGPIIGRLIGRVGPDEE